MKRRFTFARVVFALSLAVVLAIAVADTTKPANPAMSLAAGKLQLKSAGPLAFGTDGVLFVGDSIGGPGGRCEGADIHSRRDL